MTMQLSVNRGRLYRALEELGRIGAYRDAATGLEGVCRLALSDADAAGRRHVVEQMRALDLAVTVDRIGNVFARREGRDERARPVMLGSHIDSVATAGRFDGCLGVLGGLEVVRTLAEAGVVTRRPIVVAFFTEEEGCRFGTDMLGSAVATGRIPIEDAWSLRDRSGASVRVELARIGFLGEAPELLAAPFAYLECHIEQGPLLAQRGLDVGVVTGVQAICWHEVTITGKSAHAGTTPTELRADAGLAAARINVRLRELVESGRFGPGLRATVGALTHAPGLVNVVPGGATLTVDLRNPDDAALERAEAEVLACYDEIARRDRVEVRWRRTARTPSVPFAPALQQRIAAAASRRGLPAGPIVSGAGHDAQEMARRGPAAMIFVPGEHDGISHNPREHSTVDQCGNGADVLLDVCRELAEEEGP